jgi:3,4-dihydroxy 2-butanone 4-phosphate synthase / GTP cyclohydrolase II
MHPAIQRVNAAINALKKGQMIILTDDPSRENEGDLILPAEMMTPDAMNFIIQESTGIVCVSLEAAQLKKLQLPLMVPQQDNTSLRGTPFTLSIDAKNNITTGVSAHDRAYTVRLLAEDNITADDFVKPGHIFPLQARGSGVLERQGHTEGALDLVKLAGFKPVAALCEIMNKDGTMARGASLEAFAAKHQLVMLSIADLIHYRRLHENLITEEVDTTLPLAKYGTFKMKVVREAFTHEEHIILFKDSLAPPPLVRIHSSCHTGDIFGSTRCDCQQQMHYALDQISQAGGLFIYLKQEGRGIGLLNKIKAYQLQDQGFDTVDANLKLGFPADARQYYFAAAILRRYGLADIRLLTNNPQKIAGLQAYGIDTIQPVSMPIFHHQNNLEYLKTKKDKLQQNIALDFLGEG